MSDNNLITKNAGDIISEDDPNQYKEALRLDVVPRDLNGEPADLGGSLGSTLLRWFRGFFESVFLGDASEEWELTNTSDDFSVYRQGVLKFLVENAGYNGDYIADGTGRRLQFKIVSTGGAQNVVTPSDASYAFIFGCGGGGGGGGGRSLTGPDQLTAGGGGAGGGASVFLSSRPVKITPGETIVCTRGAGGTAGTGGTGATAGGNGGDSTAVGTFGTMTFQGATGGPAGSTSGTDGAGGGNAAASGFLTRIPNMNIGGGDGGGIETSGVANTTSDDGESTAYYSGGLGANSGVLVSGGGYGGGGGGGGGASFFGAGGNGGKGGNGNQTVAPNIAEDGVAPSATSYGAGGGGGGGAGAPASGPARPAGNGAAGANGVIIIACITAKNFDGVI